MCARSIKISISNENYNVLMELTHSEAWQFDHFREGTILSIDQVIELLIDKAYDEGYIVLEGGNANGSNEENK